VWLVAVSVMLVTVVLWGVVETTVDEVRVTVPDVAEENVLVRDVVGEDVAVKVTRVDRELMLVDEDNVLVLDTDVAQVHGQFWIACGMLHAAKGHQAGSQVVVVAVAVVAVVAVVVVAVAVNVSVTQEHRQTWKVSSIHLMRKHQRGSHVVVTVVEL